MNPFYAYACERTPGITESFILVFSSRDVADEWWRAVSKDPICNNIVRISPKFYTYEKSKIDLSLGENKVYQEISTKFSGHLVIRVEGYGSNFVHNFHWRVITTLPSPNVFTDHISGGWFYIRSVSDPQSYWSSQGRYIGLTDRYDMRTAFCVTAPAEKEGTIMINSDKIHITLSPKSDYFVSYLDVNGEGLLVTMEGRNDTQLKEFSFGDIRQGRFGLSFGKSTLKYDPTRPARQDVWELVDAHIFS